MKDNLGKMKLAHNKARVQSTVQVKKVQIIQITLEMKI